MNGSRNYSRVRGFDVQHCEKGKIVVKKRLGKLRSFFMDESGQGMVEYILIIGLIVLFILLALFIFRNTISEFIDKVVDSISGTTVETPGG